jgi:hypothetical protein
MPRERIGTIPDVMMEYPCPHLVQRGGTVVANEAEARSCGSLKFERVFTYTMQSRIQSSFGFYGMSEVEGSESGLTGKQGELHVFGMLLQHGFSVYTPMLDWTGIDCVIDAGDGKYKEIQIKTRRSNALFQMRSTKPRDNLFVVCYLMSEDECWVIPSKVFFKQGTRLRRAEKEYVRVSIGKEGSSSYERFRQYRDNFHLLTKGASSQVKTTVEQASRRIAGDHVTQRRAEVAVLLTLLSTRKYLSTKEIIDSVGQFLSSRLSPADLTRLKSGPLRWEATVRSAIYQGLKKKGFIESVGKNQWVITHSGRTYIATGDPLFAQKEKSILNSLYSTLPMP